MNTLFAKIIKRFQKHKALKPKGRKGILKLGHREYVGGVWEVMGKLQFDFMVNRGLKPNHVFLDIACGCLRGGRYFIEYLDKGNYLGIEKEKLLIRLGIEKELGKELYEIKTPEFIVSEKFEFEKFSKIPTYVLAQSLFTHLNQSDIELCLKRLRTFVREDCHFYATFFKVPSIRKAHKPSHPHAYFAYMLEEMTSFGKKYGWVTNYIGNWNHPADQKMIEYIAI